MNDIFLTDFTDLRFQKAFQTYFQELGIQVRDWEGLFTEMNGDSHGNAAYVRLDGERAAGFIQFCPMELSGWFFSKKLGFIREFWPRHGPAGAGGKLVSKPGLRGGHLDHGHRAGILYPAGLPAGPRLSSQKQRPGIHQTLLLSVQPQ